MEEMTISVDGADYIIGYWTCSIGGEDVLVMFMPDALVYETPLHGQSIEETAMPFVREHAKLPGRTLG